MRSAFLALLCASLFAAILFPLSFAAGQEKKPEVVRINISPPSIKCDPSVKYDYDIVYVRAPRRADGKEATWAEFSRPISMEPGADLMLHHPDGSEEVLVSGKMVR